MARFRFTWDEKDIGHPHEFYYGFIFRGALAWLQGLPIESDPHGSSEPAFSNAWRQGWEGAAKGKIKVKVFKGAQERKTTFL